MPYAVPNINMGIWADGRRGVAPIILEKTRFLNMVASKQVLALPLHAAIGRCGGYR
jgi:hypothetical protein